MLVFSGAGSLASQRCVEPAKAAMRATALVVILVLVQALLLPAILDASQGLPIGARAGIAAALGAPLAFAMGFAFPLGLRTLENTQPSHLPWAWGINGCLSVVAAPLATLIAVEGGFTLVFAFAAACYFAAAVAMARRIG